MLRMVGRSALRLLAVLLPLGLGACADTLTSGQPVASSSELLREYDKTLTKTEQEAVISELQKDQAKATGQEDTTQQQVTASTPASAKPAAKQD